MALRLDDKWIWDFWLAEDGPDYHLFYLQAPRSLIDPELRHWHVSIGHAVSQDVQNWTVLPDALAPSPVSAWDDRSIWTGSIIRYDGLWHMLYTGTSYADEGNIQRIGLATSSDLMKWDKHPQNPLIEANPNWYESLNPDWEDQSWRDPWVFQHPTTKDFHAFITARVNTGPGDERGVIAHARSDDLISWEVLPPVTEPGEFGKLEVPQLVEINGNYYLLFCTLGTTTAEARAKRISSPPVTGTHYLVADNPLGPFRYSTDHFFAGDEVGSLYSGKLVQDPNGTWRFLAFRNLGADHEFVGEIIDPLPLEIDDAGNLSVQDSAAKEA